MIDVSVPWLLWTSVIECCLYVLHLIKKPKNERT